MTLSTHAGEAGCQGGRYRDYLARGRNAAPIVPCCGTAADSASFRRSRLTAEFLRRVADGRKKSVEDVDKIAQGHACGRASIASGSTPSGSLGRPQGTPPMPRPSSPSSARTTMCSTSSPSLSLREQLLMQLRSQALSLEPRSTAQRHRADAGSAARTRPARLPTPCSPRGLYAYCWCKSRRRAARAQRTLAARAPHSKRARPSARWRNGERSCRQPDEARQVVGDLDGQGADRYRLLVPRRGRGDRPADLYRRRGA